MIVDNMAPVSKFITTDILGQNKYNKFTTGYIYSVIIPYDAGKPYVQASSVINRIGKTGKRRISVTDLFLAPIVHKELIKHDFYTGITHALTKMDTCNVLEMSNHDFLSWAYAHILRVERFKIRHIWPEAKNKLMMDIRNICRTYDDVSDHRIAHVVGNTFNREQFLLRLRQIYSFLKAYVVNESKNINTRLLTKHIALVNAKIPDEIYNELVSQKDMLSKGKGFTAKTLTETEDVLHEYKSSGYWV